MPIGRVRQATGALINIYRLSRLWIADLTDHLKMTSTKDGVSRAVVTLLRRLSDWTMLGRALEEVDQT